MKSWGTEGRAEEGMHIPPAEQLHEMVQFRGEDIKDLHVHEVGSLNVSLFLSLFYRHSSTLFASPSESNKIIRGEFQSTAAASLPPAGAVLFRCRSGIYDE